MNIIISCQITKDKKELNWYGHVRRMNEGKVPQKNIWNIVHLEDEKVEEEGMGHLEIRGCRN